MKMGWEPRGGQDPHVLSMQPDGRGVHPPATCQAGGGEEIATIDRGVMGR